MFRFYDFIRLVVVTPPLLASGQMKLVGVSNLPTGGGFIFGVNSHELVRWTMVGPRGRATSHSFHGKRGII